MNISGMRTRPFRWVDNAQYVPQRRGAPVSICLAYLLPRCFSVHVRRKFFSSDLFLRGERGLSVVDSGVRDLSYVIKS